MSPPPPAARGFRMPAEWEPHEATWIAWPHEKSDWPGKFGPVPWVYAEIVRHLHRSERVRVLVNGPELRASATAKLRKAGIDFSRIEFLEFPTDRSWCRDSAAIFVKGPGGDLGALDWHFNAWARYDNYHNDDALPARMADWLGVPSWTPVSSGRRVVLEGGSIEVNGRGLLLTTEECLLSPVQARNPGLDRPTLEGILADYLGASKVLWLNRGIAGDDTHGHIDDIARFVSERAVLAAVEEDPRDENFEPLHENLERLRAMTDLDGRPLELHTIPMPEPVTFRGRRLPASYANFYIANNRVLVPTFNDPADRRALGKLAELFPGREVVGIHSVDLVWGLGTMHCLSQQEPARELKS